MADVDFIFDILENVGKNIGPLVEKIGKFYQVHKKTIDKAAKGVAIAAPAVVFGAEEIDKKKKVADARLKGEESGYKRASEEYAEKLLNQADLFLAQKEKYDQKIEGYEDLICELEATIQEFQEKSDKTDEDHKLINLLSDKKAELDALAS